MRLSISTSFLRNGIGRTCTMAAMALGLSSAIFSCGSVSDPDAVKQDELKRPESLRILDQGNGTVVLSWAGTNNESDFDGYNIFGMKGEDSALGTTEGQAIELLDSAGAVDTDAKTIMQNYNYNIDNPFNVKGEKVDSSKEFSYLPRYNKDSDGTTPLLPSCRPNGTTCDEVTTSNKSASGTVTLNGRTSFTVSGLTVGDRYCFFVMSSMKSGKKVSASSSEVVCTVPKYKLTVQLKTTSSLKSTGIKLTTIRTACATSCPDLSTFAAGTYFTQDNTLATTANIVTTKTENLFLETFSSNYNLTSGSGTGITDMGYYADGFSDATLIDQANTYAPSSTNTVEGPTGYTIEAQSLRVENGRHVYVIATKDPADATKYFYDWLYISSETVTADTAFTAELRLSKTSDVLSN